MKTGYGMIVALALLIFAGCGSKSGTGDEIDSRPGEEKTSAQSEQRSDNRLTALVKSPAQDKVEYPDFSTPEILQKILGKAILWDTLEERGLEGEKLYYAPGSKTPYTGWRKRMHGNGKVQMVSHIKDGKWEGPYVSWHDNGEKKSECTYEDGGLDGLYTSWYDNGERASERTYKDGELDGLYTMWCSNGERREATYKDGKREGPHTMWHGNGQKALERIYKDGELEGLMASWHDNGQKKSERTYKDGKREGLMTVWDKDGTLVSQTRYIGGVKLVE